MTTNEVMNDLFRSKSPVPRNLESHVLADIGVSGAAKIWGGRVEVGPLQGHKKRLGGTTGGVIGGDVFVRRSLARVPHY